MSEEFKIEKDIPVKRQQKSLLYRTDEIPFGEMEVGDSVAVPLSKLIYGNEHPDKKETSNALNSISNYLKRRFPNKKFIQRMINGPKYSKSKKPYEQLCIRFWRVE